MKILLLGSSGVLGGECNRVLSKDYEVIAPAKEELDIRSWDGVIENMNKHAPDVILNCVDFSNVDRCESANSFTLRKINVEGPRNLAQGAARFNCKLIHVSSVYVFSGEKSAPQPYFEDDPLEPGSAYGRSKMESEVAVKENAPNYTIIRSGWLYGIQGQNFMLSILRNSLNKKSKTIKVIDDQFGSPTWTYRLALQIKELVQKESLGTYHATSEGYCSRFEYAKYFLGKLNVKASLEACSTDEYPQKAKRPQNCILENRSLKKQGFSVMADWKEDVDTFLAQYGEELIKLAKTGKP